MKMLEICLKLVGCKSKRGLSSSSSCYLEGKNDFLLGLFLLITHKANVGQRPLGEIERENDKVSPHNGTDFCTVETQVWGGESRK